MNVEKCGYCDGPLTQFESDNRNGICSACWAEDMADQARNEREEIEHTLAENQRLASLEQTRKELLNFSIEALDNFAKAEQKALIMMRSSLFRTNERELFIDISKNSFLNFIYCSQLLDLLCITADTDLTAFIDGFCGTPNTLEHAIQWMRSGDCNYARKEDVEEKIRCFEAIRAQEQANALASAAVNSALEEERALNARDSSLRRTVSRFENLIEKIPSFVQCIAGFSREILGAIERTSRNKKNSIIANLILPGLAYFIYERGYPVYRCFSNNPKSLFISSDSKAGFSLLRSLC
jgi:hypothetical protein